MHVERLPVKDMKAGLRNIRQKLSSVSRLFGFDPAVFCSSIRGLPYYVTDFIELRRQAKKSNNAFTFEKLYPCLSDRFYSAGTASGHYFYQDLVVAQKIFQNNPKKHVDIGSRIDGFVAHVGAYRNIEVFDIRPVSSQVPNVTFTCADFMDDRKIIPNYCDSVSSLHAIEHFGLGRYGDPVDYDGHIKALNNIYKMLKAGGRFYFSVPIGAQRIEFNAQRVLSLTYLLELFRDLYILHSFSYVNDEGNLVMDLQLTEDQILSNCGCLYGCGIFELIKI